MKVTQSCPTLCDPHGLHSPWNSPGQNTGVGIHSLLQGIFPTQGSNPGLLRCRKILHQLSHKGGPCLIHSSTREVVNKTEEMFVLIELIIYRETQELKRKMVTVTMEDLQKIWRTYMKTVGII